MVFTHLTPKEGQFSNLTFEVYFMTSQMDLTLPTMGLLQQPQILAEAQCVVHVSFVLS